MVILHSLSMECLITVRVLLSMASSDRSWLSSSERASYRSFPTISPRKLTNSFLSSITPGF
jgi:hypothetical protein